MHKKSNTLTYKVEKFGALWGVIRSDAPEHVIDGKYYRFFTHAARRCRQLERISIQDLSSNRRILRAYWMSLPDSIDLYRLRSGKMTDGDLLRSLLVRFEQIKTDGKLHPCQTEKNHLERLTGEDQLLRLSLGKRHRSEERACSCFVFDAEELLRSGAILRDGDFHSAYEDILRDSVKTFAQERQEDYYSLLDAVEHQNLDTPFCKEATDTFLQEIQAYQSNHQWTGPRAILRARQEGETGRYTILVPGVLPLTKALATIEGGR